MNIVKMHAWAQLLPVTLSHDLPTYNKMYIPPYVIVKSRSLVQYAQTSQPLESGNRELINIH